MYLLKTQCLFTFVDYGGCLDTRVNLFASSDEQFITSANFPKQYPT